jgi:hypothetical protein
MTLGPIKPGDIVKVDIRGLQFHAIAGAKDNGRLQFEPIQRGITYHEAKPREVIAHWGKRGRARASVEASSEPTPLAAAA